METKLQLRIQRYGWDAAAPVYEDEWRDNLSVVQGKLLDALNLEQGLSVIETAAGSGLVTMPIAKAIAPSGSVTATDISGEMVRVCSEKAAELGLENITFERQNAENLDIEDNTFDRAVCGLGLMYCPNPDIALSEMKRVLRPGGRAAVAVWGERRNCGWAEIFPITDAQVQSEVCPMFFGLGPAGVLISEMERCGFSEVQEDRLMTKMRFSSKHQLLRAIIDGGAVALAAKRFDAETRKTVEKEFLASVSEFATGDGYEIPGEFVVVSGTA
jgi:ubiquinone/menaquinone biosynthesis C-methylase UbiE